MRAHLAPLAALLLAVSLAADPVRLRSKANGNIIDAEVVEVTPDNLAFRLVGGERLYILPVAAIRRDPSGGGVRVAQAALLLERSEFGPDRRGTAVEPG